MHIHLDTDIGGDTDDACALVMLLGWPGVELTGITTSIDPGGRRAGAAAFLLELAGRTGVPVVAGAEHAWTNRSSLPPTTADERHWPTPPPARVSPPGAAADALQRSIDEGATIVAIGPYTNLALLETMRPGTLGRASIVLMGGWLDLPKDGLTRWGPEMDWNVQWDTGSALVVVAAAGELTLVTLPVTLHTHQRAAHLPRLRASGPLGRLLALQSEAHGAEFDMHDQGQASPGLPDDLLNYQYDALTCAVAAGWPGVTTQLRRIRTRMDGDLLRFEDHPDGRPCRVVTAVDGPAFEERWLHAVERADASA